MKETNKDWLEDWENTFLAGAEAAEKAIGKLFKNGTLGSLQGIRTKFGKPSKQGKMREFSR